MPTKICFTVPAVPVSQPRPRAYIAGQRARMGTVSDKHPVNGFKAAVMHQASLAYDGPPLAVPLAMTLVFVMPRPTTKVWKTKPMPREPYAAKKNDWDNLGKSVCDALNGTMYDDDGRLVDVRVQRWIAAGDEQPHVEVTIEEVR